VVGCFKPAQHRTGLPSYEEAEEGASESGGDAPARCCCSAAVRHGAFSDCERRSRRTVKEWAPPKLALRLPVLNAAGADAADSSNDVRVDEKGENTAHTAR